MASMNTAEPKSVARSLSVPERIVLAQAVAALLVLLAWVVIDTAEIGSALLGTLAVLLPNAWLAWQFHKTHAAGREVGQALAKFGLTIALILLVFVAFTPSAAGFFSPGGLLVDAAARATLSCAGDPGRGPAAADPNPNPDKSPTSPTGE